MDLRTDGDYIDGIATLTGICKALLQLIDVVDVGKLRRICAEYEALAPILQPTAYINEGGAMNLADQAAFLAAVDEFVTALRKLDRRPAEQAGDDRVCNGCGASDTPLHEGLCAICTHTRAGNHDLAEQEAGQALPTWED